jgi:hypothetical protein
MTGLLPLLLQEYKSVFVTLCLFGLGLIISFIPVYNRSYSDVLAEIINTNTVPTDKATVFREVYRTDKYLWLLRFSAVIVMPLLCLLVMKLCTQTVVDFMSFRALIINLFIVLAILVPVSMLDMSNDRSSLTKMSGVLCTSQLQQLFLFGAFLFAFHPLAHKISSINAGIVPILCGIFILSVLLEAVSVDSAHSSDAALAVLAVKIVLYVLVLLYVLLWANNTIHRLRAQSARPLKSNSPATTTEAPANTVHNENGNNNNEANNPAEPTNHRRSYTNCFHISALDAISILRNVVILLALIGTCSYTSNYATVTVRNEFQALEKRAEVMILLVMFVIIFDQAADYIHQCQLRVDHLRIYSELRNSFALLKWANKFSEGSALDQSMPVDIRENAHNIELYSTDNMAPNPAVIAKAGRSGDDGSERQSRYAEVAQRERVAGDEESNPPRSHNNNGVNSSPRDEFEDIFVPLIGPEQKYWARKSYLEAEHRLRMLLTSAVLVEGLRRSSNNGNNNGTSGGGGSGQRADDGMHLSTRVQESSVLTIAIAVPDALLHCVASFCASGQEIEEENIANNDSESQQQHQQRRSSNSSGSNQRIRESSFNSSSVLDQFASYNAASEDKDKKKKHKDKEKEKDKEKDNKGKDKEKINNDKEHEKPKSKSSSSDQRQQQSVNSSSSSSSGGSGNTAGGISNSGNNKENIKANNSKVGASANASANATRNSSGKETFKLVPRLSNHELLTLLGIKVEVEDAGSSTGAAAGAGVGASAKKGGSSGGSGSYSNSKHSSSRRQSYEEEGNNSDKERELLNNTMLNSYRSTGSSVSGQLTNASSHTTVNRQVLSTTTTPNNMTHQPRNHGNANGQGHYDNNDDDEDEEDEIKSNDRARSSTTGTPTNFDEGNNTGSTANGGATNSLTVTEVRVRRVSSYRRKNAFGVGFGESAFAKLDNSTTSSGNNANTSVSSSARATIVPPIPTKSSSSVNSSSNNWPTNSGAAANQDNIATSKAISSNSSITSINSSTSSKQQQKKVQLDIQGHHHQRRGQPQQVVQKSTSNNINTANSANSSIVSASQQSQASKASKSSSSSASSAATTAVVSIEMRSSSSVRSLGMMSPNAQIQQQQQELLVMMRQSTATPIQSTMQQSSQSQLVKQSTQTQSKTQQQAVTTILPPPRVQAQLSQHLTQQQPIQHHMQQQPMQQQQMQQQMQNQQQQQQQQLLQQYYQQQAMIQQQQLQCQQQLLQVQSNPMLLQQSPQHQQYYLQLQQYQQQLQLQNAQLQTSIMLIQQQQQQQQMQLMPPPPPPLTAPSIQPSKQPQALPQLQPQSHPQLTNKHAKPAKPDATNNSSSSSSYKYTYDYNYEGDDYVYNHEVTQQQLLHQQMLLEKQQQAEEQAQLQQSQLFQQLQAKYTTAANNSTTNAEQQTANGHVGHVGDVGDDDDGVDYMYEASSGHSSGNGDDGYDNPNEDSYSYGVNSSKNSFSYDYNYEDTDAVFNTNPAVGPVSPNTQSIRLSLVGKIGSNNSNTNNNNHDESSNNVLAGLSGRLSNQSRNSNSSSQHNIPMLNIPGLNSPNNKNSNGHSNNEFSTNGNGNGTVNGANSTNNGANGASKPSTVGNGSTSSAPGNTSPAIPNTPTTPTTPADDDDRYLRYAYNDYSQFNNNYDYIGYDEEELTVVSASASQAMHVNSMHNVYGNNYDPSNHTGTTPSYQMNDDSYYDEMLSSRPTDPVTNTIAPDEGGNNSGRDNMMYEQGIKNIISNKIMTNYMNSARTFDDNDDNYTQDDNNSAFYSCDFTVVSEDSKNVKVVSLAADTHKQSSHHANQSPASDYSAQGKEEERAMNAYARSLVKATLLQFRSVGFAGRPDVSELLLNATELGSHMLSSRFLLDQLSVDITTVIDVFRLVLGNVDTDMLNHSIVTVTEYVAVIDVLLSKVTACSLLVLNVPDGVCLGGADKSNVPDVYGVFR